jgi:hypothetical protein
VTDAAALVVRDLRELISALDRRIPQLERATEADIARNAKVLRDVAVRHIGELTDALPGGAWSVPGDSTSEVRWQAWLAKGRAHEGRTRQKVRAFGLTLFIVAALAMAAVLALG